MRGLVTPIVLLLALLITATSLSAADWYVKPDRTGDAATIQAAVDAAAPGDTILLADGTFTGDGNRDIFVYAKPLLFMSESLDPDLCVIDCGGTETEFHQGFDLHVAESPWVMIVGVTVRGAYTNSGGAVYVGLEEDQPGQVSLVNCVLTENNAVYSGPAMLVFHDCFANLVTSRVTGNYASDGGAIYLASNSALTVSGGVFSNNGADVHGGAISTYGGTLILSSCTFSGNTTTGTGGAIYGTEGAALALLGCTLSGNNAFQGGGAVYFDGEAVSLSQCSSMHNWSQYGASLRIGGAATVLVANCSFVADSSGYGAILMSDGISPVIDRTVIAFGKETAAISCFGTPGDISVTCSDFFGNESGDWIACVEGLDGTEGNISEDPLFCDLENGSVAVEDCSPCLAAHNTCGLDMGAGILGCACGEATEPTTWGAIKAMYK